MAYKSGNPALNKDTFKNEYVHSGAAVMTLDGTARKSLIMLVFALISGGVAWHFVATGNPIGIIGLIASLIAATIIGLILVFKHSWAPVLAPIYAILEGFVLGAISQMYEADFGGIVIQAILLTFGIFAGMLMLYLFRIIKATENFKLGVASATIGIALYYIGFMIAGFFGVELPLVADNSWWGIGFTLFVIVIAALNLVVDFDFIEAGAEAKAPKYMEWYASFGLFVTLVWLYLEILRLLAKLRSRD